MALKRQLREGGDGDSQLENKRRHLLSIIFKGASRLRSLEESVPMLEPIIRNWVKEEVGRAIDPYLSQSLDTQSERRRSLHFQFQSCLPTTLFTGNKITSPIKIGLYDPSCRQIVTSGPYSSSKVAVVVLQGDFDSDEWSSKDFSSKVVQSREGKRPLLNGEAVVALKEGVGYIDSICFTDNSSWDRSGKFRLGVKLHSRSSVDVREGVSSAFKVKDQRGESYQKHHPPLLSDEVWRLEKIAKDGTYHKQLSKLGISSVGDFLRSLALDPTSLRTALSKISKKKWEAITGHAARCVLDDKRYVYTAAQGAALVFNSVYALTGVTFDGLTYLSLDALDGYQKKTVEELKHLAFRNLSSWGSCEEPNPNILPQTVGQGEVEMQINNRSFELGESSEMQGFNLAFTNSLSDSAAGFYDFEEN